MADRREGTETVDRAEGDAAAGYDAWRRARLARRLEAGDAPAAWNHAITVVVYPLGGDAGAAVAATLASLRAQLYRNIEVLVTGGFGGEAAPEVPADGFEELRGLFREPGADPGAILADAGCDGLWRGSHIVFAPAGTEFAEDAFRLFNAAVQPAGGLAPPDLVLCDHDRLDGAGGHAEPCFLPGWDAGLVGRTDCVGSAFMASRRLVRSRRGGRRSDSLHDWLRGIADARPQPATRHIAEPLVHMPAEAPRAPVDFGRPEDVPTADRAVRDGLCVLGHLRAQDGLGQAARLIAQACDTSRMPLSFYHLPVPERNDDREFVTKCTPSLDRRANLLVVGLASMPSLKGLNPQRHNILYPYWEVPKVPAAWMPVVRQFREIWAPTGFIASMFADGFSGPVELVPQPVRLPDAMPPPRAGRDCLRFFTFFHFDSLSSRKNPQAAVKAFRAAFAPGTLDVELVVKVHGSQDRGLRRWLAQAASEDKRIRIVDRTLDRAGMDALMGACDAFISLHRSEGFGLGAAEALAAGKAVVATDYSGTTDFITRETGYPVAFDLEPVPAGAFIDTEGQVWAAPRLDAAVAALRAVHDDPDAAARRTARGFALLKQTYAAEVVGRRIRALLEARGLLGSEARDSAAP